MSVVVVEHYLFVASLALPSTVFLDVSVFWSKSMATKAGFSQC